MKSTFYHLQVNIDYTNIAFYKELMAMLGWNVIFEDKAVAGFKSEGMDIWFTASKSNIKPDYDEIGINHLSFKVKEQDEVDIIRIGLEKMGVQMLFETPRHRPEFSAGNDQTYYQIMFATPDNILMEVVYTGIKK